MPIIELESASLHDSAYDSYSTLIDHAPLRPVATDSDYSSNRERYPMPDVRRAKSEDIGSRSTVKQAFTNFTESLSHSSEEFQESVQKTFSSINAEELQDSVQKTFSSIASSFSREVTSSSGASESGFDDNASSYSYGSGSEKKGLQKMKWSEFSFPDELRSRVSSLTSRSTYFSSSSNDSSLSSRSNSPRMNSDQFSILVDNAGLVIHDSSGEDNSSGCDSSSVASWHETASRDRSLLDTIGERDGEDDDDESSSSSCSESGSEGEEDEGIGREFEGGEDAIAYEYDDDHTEFDSDDGLDDLGDIMMQIGSCHFEPESASLSFEDEEYTHSFSSELFPPVVSNYLSGFREGDADKAGLYSGAAKNALLQKQLRQRQRAQQQQEEEANSIASFFSKAFSCGGGTF